MGPTFADFDRRGYRMVDARTGYAGWVATYEETVRDDMDLALLDALTVPDWSAVGRAADLACGTGRTAAWLRGRGVGHIDGVDLTPEMLAVARRRGLHDRLVEADVGDTGLDGAAYDLVVASLVDEHLASLGPLYTEAHRLLRPGGLFAHVSFHPHFIMASGMPTHFRSTTGEDVAITTHVHLVSEHVAAALTAGFTLAELREGVVDEAWLAAKPSWAPFRGHPVSMASVWRAGPG